MFCDLESWASQWDVTMEKNFYIVDIDSQPQP